ncbi:MAG: NADP-dependent oxidoreductase [Burkholderiaceae bacterium]
MSTMNKQIVLAARPEKVAGVEHFRLEEVPMPTPGPGEVLVRNHYMSLDPYMRGRMDDTKSYTASQPVGEVMIGGTVGEVVESNDPSLKAGDQVVGMLGWQHYGVADAKTFRKLDTTHVPLSAYLGVVGMPGVTAWIGLNRIIEPKEGETVVVSAASGAVGSAVGQLAKMKGCRVVGIAGGPEKCAIVTGEYGFDACVDYKANNLRDDLKAACPDGIDGVFENVGGPILDEVLRNMNAFGRIAVCGLISGYNGEPIPVQNFRSVLVNRLKLEGFIVTERPDDWPAALSEMGAGVATGKIKYRETVAEGLESAPEAFVGLLKGRNVGKQLVKLI